MTYLDLLGSSGLLGLSNGCEELGLYSCLELGGGSVCYLLLRLLGRLSCLHRHLLSANLRETTQSQCIEGLHLPRLLSPSENPVTVGVLPSAVLWSVLAVAVLFSAGLQLPPEPQLPDAASSSESAAGPGRVASAQCHLIERTEKSQVQTSGPIIHLCHDNQHREQQQRGYDYSHQCIA